MERLTRATGRTFLTATTDDAPALEGYRGHGLFTYSLLDALDKADTNNNQLAGVAHGADRAQQPRIRILHRTGADINARLLRLRCNVEKWLEFISYFDTREAALARISHPPSLPVGYYRPQHPNLSPSNEDGKEKIEKLYLLGNTLIGAFRDKLIREQIIASFVLSECSRSDPRIM